MADIRIKDLATTASSTASDDFLAVDGSANGTRKLSAYSPTFGGTLTVTGGIVGSAIGASSPSTGAFTTLSASGAVTANATTDSSSKDTGAIVTEGGLGVEKSATIGGNLTVSGTGTSSFAGNLATGGATGSSWSNGKAIEVAFAGSGIWGFTQENTYLTANAYFNGGWKYGGTGKASTYAAGAGGHSWGICDTSGTAGNAVTLTTAMTLNSSGNLGIGTTSPVTTLNLVKTLGSSGTIGNSLLHLGSAGSLGNIYPITFGYSGSSAVNPPAFLGMEITDGNSYTKGALVFGLRDVTTDTLPTERVRIFSNGNFGIGTGSTDGGQKLQVSGTAYIGSATTTTNPLTVQGNGPNTTHQAGTSTAALWNRWLNSAGTRRGYYGYASSGDSTFTIMNEENGSFVLGTNNATVLTLDSSQNATFEGTIAPKASTGTALFSLDTAGQTFTVANDGTATPFSNANNFSGLFIINDTSVTGHVALVLTGAGSIGIVYQTGTSFSVTQGTASKTNVYLNGSVVTVENKSGSSCNYNIMALRTRQSQ